MRLVFALLILIQLHPVARAAEMAPRKRKPAEIKSKVSKTTVTLPKEIGDELAKKAQQCDQALQTLNGTINNGPNCLKKAEVKEQGEDQQAKILKEMGMNGPAELSYEVKDNKREIKGRTTPYKDLSGRELTLSVLTPDEADQVVEKLRETIGDLKYHRSETGCFARAHLLGQRLQDLGVEAGKMWFEPTFMVGKLNPILNGKTERGNQEWRFHVAPFILVDNNGKIEERVVDFALNSKAMPLKEYKEKLSPRPYWLSASPGNRFAYDMRERWQNKTYYNGSDQARAVQEIRCIEKDLRDGTRSCVVVDGR